MVARPTDPVEQRRPRLHAAFTMGQYDYSRIDRLLRIADNAGLAANQGGGLSAMENYLAALKMLYTEFYAMLYETKKPELEDAFKQVTGELRRLKWRKIRNMPVALDWLSDTLWNLHKRLILRRQEMGMGVEARPKESERTKMNRVLLGENR